MGSENVKGSTVKSFIGWEDFFFTVTIYIVLVVELLTLPKDAPVMRMINISNRVPMLRCHNTSHVNFTQSKSRPDKD